MTRTRLAAAVLLTAAMAAVGAGCSGQPPSDQQIQSIGNGIFAIIYVALCNANGGVCPFPIAPSDPLPPTAAP